ncbi:DUF3618 domain-containing protein [Microbacterium trichothecenolyticum]|uniref:Gas vesicle protein n=1 Tax=Microbacterium trichothecenolyticum TaxID=69370 RepID=A0ABU0TYT0_MICTR|nr:DUF3618 domain-containing protein [Microbacterium trichothecenolyticum]MDQ1124808.1 gas vesicle protein [Microbacterium trichothecenolyticum]
MTDSPEAIRADIERTRAELGSDVDALADKVTPSKIIDRQKGKVHGALRGLREKVMGAVDDSTSAGSDLAHGAADAVHGVAHDTVSKAKGNPLAVGLVAFGAGLVLASLIPPSRAERDAAAQAREKAQPLVDQAKDVAQEVAAHLKEPAADAAAAVKDRAAEAVQHVKDDSAEAAAAVRDRAEDAGHTVREA